MEEIRAYEMYLNELIEKRKDELSKKNKEYKKSRNELDNIFNECDKLQYILEEHKDISLSTEECRMLQKLIRIHMDIRDMEEKEIFLLGGQEMYFYLKDTGLIRK